MGTEVQQPWPLLRMKLLNFSSSSGDHNPFFFGFSFSVSADPISLLLCFSTKPLLFQVFSFWLPPFILLFCYFSVVSGFGSVRFWIVNDLNLTDGCWFDLVCFMFNISLYCFKGKSLHVLLLPTVFGCKKNDQNIPFWFHQLEWLQHYFLSFNLGRWLGCHENDTAN